MRCETDYCATKPCINGVCTASSAGYNCVCNTGFTGQNCAQTINLCSNFTCLNSGICIQNNLNQTAYCICQTGFTGKNCETQIDNCYGSPCKNGATCLATLNSFNCKY